MNRNDTTEINPVVQKTIKKHNIGLMYAKTRKRNSLTKEIEINYTEEQYYIMSPEPTQEPVEENLNVPDLPRDTRDPSDSDTDDEDIALAGYLPLSQVPTNDNSILDDYEDPIWGTVSRQTNQGLSVPTTGSHHVECPPETIEVWSLPRNQSNIDMDAEKISQVKSMMASFTLPATAFPEWANSISEDQWKEQLMRRIKEMQDRDK